MDMGNEMIVINNDKAIAIAKDKIREIRNPKLTALDVEFQKALETSLDTTLIVQAKNELRDMTKITDGKTVDELLIILGNLEND